MSYGRGFKRYGVSQVRSDVEDRKQTEPEATERTDTKLVEYIAWGTE